ncbi:hypothetical protein ACNSOL_11515 (plasmid) [Aliarcobacter lanthieri]|uniref:hypothetical protein n=1 Tax=Aliarcobacter lanthieri TaxID=1355374 RepID=UPI003AAC67A0
MNEKEKPVKIADLFHSKVVATLEEGEDVVNFIEKYIEEKTYKTFRTFSKRLKEVTQELLEYGLIDNDGALRIKEAIRKKREIQEPKLIFSIERFLDDYKLIFNSIKNNVKNPLNTLFLALPFIKTDILKNIVNIRISDIKIDEYEGYIRIYNIANEKSLPIVLVKCCKEYLELFNIYKSKSETEFIFRDLGNNHTVFSNIYHKYLSKYSKVADIDHKYFSSIKKALNYSRTSLFAQ